MWKKALLIIAIILLSFVGVVITVVGPWPTYGPSAVEATRYYRTDLDAIDRQLAQLASSTAPGRLQAGWASAKMTPPIGTPLAGYGDRRGAPSTGVHDDLYVKALALSDGSDTVVLVGSDMLIVPENVAELVRVDVAARTPLKASDILFSASHTHSGPGAFGPGFLAKAFSGTYDAAIPTFLASCFADAIVNAYKELKPARLAHGSVDAKDYIRNRAREGPVDSELSYLVVEQDGAPRRCYVVCFSAHATVLGGSNMQFSGDYPGYLQRFIESATGEFAMFLGGAIGSMSPRAPSGSDGFEKAAALGNALAQRVLDAAIELRFQDHVDVAGVGVPLVLPPFQFRLSPNLRLSPLLLSLVGIDHDGWLGVVRVGDCVFAGLPCDFSGEISRDLKEWARQQNRTLWVLSFSADYVGYVSPDKYYATAKRDDTEGYEMYIMSWCGPNQEAYFSGLVKHAVEGLFRAPSAS